MSNRKEDRHLVSRRDLIKYSMFVGAALGLPRWKVFEVLESAGGRALAAEAACATTNRSVHIIAGSGGFAWFQLLWPHNDVAAAGNPNFAFHAPGEQTLAPDTDKPLTLGPEAPWKTLSGRRQVTALMAGENETHTDQPTSSSTVATGVSLFAASASLQSVNPTLVPVIAVDNVPFGTAAGAPRPARVGDADGMVELFNSAASRMGGVLAERAHGELYVASYQAFQQLNRASGRPTMVKAFATGLTAAQLLGKNLAAALRPSDEELARYGIDGGSPNKLRQLAKALITTAKAFGMGLTSSVIIPAMRDDPHGAFGDMNDLRSTVRTLGMALDAFLTDLQGIDDPTCGGTKIADNTVVSIHGDTPKDPLDRGGWPDGTPRNANWMYVLGNGMLKSGWFGGVRRNGDVMTFDPQSGDDVDAPSLTTAMPAAAAVTYAITKGDMRRVQDFYRGVDIAGIIRPLDM
jgi:hypothetical protein